MGMLARLGVVLGLDSAEFSKGLEQANKKLDQFSNAARNSAVVGAAAFAAMTAKALQYADAVVDTAKANDMAVESVLALAKGLKLNGGEAANAGKMLSAFTLKIDEAASGSKEAQQMFARIGVTLNDLATMNIEELFDKTVQAVAKIDDPLKRAATGMQAFGKAGKGVDFVGLAAGSQQAREEFKQYAEAVKQAAELNDLLAEKAGKVMIRFTNEVIPTLMDLYETLGKDTEAAEAFWWVIREGTKVAAIIIKYMVTIVQGLTEDVKFLGSAIKNLFSADLNAIASDYEAYQKRIQALKQSDADFEKRLFGTPAENQQKTGQSVARVQREVTPYKDTEAERLRISLGLAQQLSEEYRRQSEFELAQVMRRTKLMQLTENEREVEEAVLRVRDQNSKQLEDIDKKITEAILKRENELAAELMFQKEQIAQMGVVYEEATRHAVERQQEIRNSFEFGWNKAFKQFAEDAENYAKLGEQAFNVFANNINSAIDKFVETGKFKFSDFTKSIIMGLIKIELKMQAMQLFKMGKSWIGSLFSAGSGGAGGAGGYSGPAVSTVGFAAAGGYIDSPTIVGENGPELFIPKSSGTVIPNQQLSSVMGNQAQVVYNGPYIENMQAIDTQSATQFLAKNKSAVWAANQSASRSIPTSR